MNIFKKFFNKKEEKIPTQVNEINKKNNLIKKIIKYFFYFLISIFFLFLILIYSLLGDFKKFFFNIPSMAGFFGEKNYLVLMVNNSEIRPGGGFISSFAEVHFFLGVPTINIKNSYDIGNPSPLIEPPYPYNKLLSSDIENYKGRVFRDGNLSPDFKINSEKIIELYNKSQNKILKDSENLEKIKNSNTNINKNINGIFSIDMNFLESLLKISGEIKINGETFNQNNFFYQTQILSKDFDLHSIEDLNSRKNFLKPLINEIFSKISKKIFYGNLDTGKKLLNEIKILSDQKHIQYYFLDDKLQNKIKISGWSGEFSPKGEDFIHVNISNIGGRKADRYIRKNCFYDLDFSGKYAIGELNIITKHLGTKSLISDFYQGYYKIFLPKGVEILNKSEIQKSFKDEVKFSEELNSFVIGGLVHMQTSDTGENKTQISIKYKLPKIVNSENYNLHLITQAGGNGENWNISVKEKTDKIWLGNIGNNFEIKENLAFFENKIFKDKILNLKNSGDKTQPVIVWQKFIEKDLIEINFSEKISTDFLKNENNFSIIDLNKKNKNIQNNNIKISKTSINGKNLYLRIEGISYEEGEFYEVGIKDIYDLSGNYTSKNPIKITVVQN